MKIAIISDVHDNTTNLKKCLKYLVLKNVDEIICCGDLTNSDTLDVLGNSFKNPIHLIRGNIEIYDERDVEKYKNIRFYGRTGEMDVDHLKIGICHEPFFIDQMIQKEETDKKLNIIFYGHTHKPWIEDRKGVKVVNPGTLGGVFQRATFSIWDTETMSLQLCILDEV